MLRRERTAFLSLLCPRDLVYYLMGGKCVYVTVVFDHHPADHQPSTRCTRATRNCPLSDEGPVVDALVQLGVKRPACFEDTAPLSRDHYSVKSWEGHLDGQACTEDRSARSSRRAHCRIRPPCRCAEHQRCRERSSRSAERPTDGSHPDHRRSRCPQLHHRRAPC